MNLYSATSAPLKEGVGKVYLFPRNENFLSITIDQNKVQKVDLLTQNDIASIKAESHYFDIGSYFNLLPKLSDELIDETALKDFMGWSSNSKVYHFLDNARSLEVQFQTSPVSDYAVSHALPAIHKHHVIEMMLSVATENGVHALVYSNQIYIAVVENNELLLCNAYQIKTDEEVMYYLLLVLQELGLSQEDVNVIFYGNFPETPAKTEEYISSYIRNYQLKQFQNIEAKYQGITLLALAYHENH